MNFLTVCMSLIFTAVTQEKINIKSFLLMSKRIYIILILAFILIPLNITSARDLEVDYPVIPGSTTVPQTTELPLEYYFEYIYIFATSIAGILALLVFAYAGYEYVTSTGNPDKMGRAKKRIFAALLGLLILALTYPILYNINPDLVEIEIADLTDIEATPLDAKKTKTISPEVLGKVKELAENIITASKTIDGLLMGGEIPDGESVEGIIPSILECNCIFATSLCWCNGGSDSSQCEPHQCFAGEDHHPCENYKDIKRWMKNIIYWKDELLYYRNWAAAEIKDLQYEIGEGLEDPENKGTIPAQIENYRERIEKTIDQRFVTYYQQQINLLEQEMALKKSLIKTLKLVGNNPDRNKDDNPHADLIKEITPYLEKLPPLLEICVEDDLGVYGLDNTCDAACLVTANICHDNPVNVGCKGLPCLPKQGIGNPCPLEKVGERDGFLELNAAILLLIPEIKSTTNRILNIIGQIRALKSFTITL